MKRSTARGHPWGRGGQLPSSAAEDTWRVGHTPREAPEGDPCERAARSRVGTRVCDKWRLDELLGIGGVGAVYAATHRNGRRVAIKTMHSELARDRAARERFLREGYLANQVDHPGVVSVLDDAVGEDGAPLLVMEFLDGESIQTRWQRKGRVLQPGEVLSIADQALDVLAAAHSAGVVHRDVKPANLFLTRTGAIKLLDFGVARAGSGNASITVGGMTALGTPAFLPPEQALGQVERIDGRTDLWALGATMLTLLSGRHVHEARTVNEVLLAAMTREAPRSADVVPGMPRDLAQILDKALAFDPDDRWRDARAMQQAVREAYQSWQGMAATLPMRPSRSRSSKGKRRSDRLETATNAVLIAVVALVCLTWGSEMSRRRAAPSTQETFSQARVGAIASVLRRVRLASSSATLDEPADAEDLPADAAAREAETSATSPGTSR